MSLTQVMYAPKVHWAAGRKEPGTYLDGRSSTSRPMDAVVDEIL
jgi:hypothetical protein